MRKAQKQQAEEFLKLLEEAHDEIRKSIQNNDISTAKSLLAECQNGAIELGNLIEKTEGENSKTVSIIEDYCELTYRLYEKIGQREDINNNKTFKTLHQLVIKIENSIEHDIPIKKEAVFLPYKASMWDSLESVWKAADEDPDCDAYVIPIPYYDKNPDGSYKEVHYEADQFPGYVPITHYDNYDFEQRKPDMIFIHNPYDEWNYVTSVHPFFYSKNLKRFTEKLVYIPYFIIGEYPPDEEDSLRGMDKYCIVPGVINADKVIVQSEDMRQIYIKVLIREFGENTKELWSEKILGLGSPKVDKVLSTRKEDLELPKEWLGIIKKPDGSFKKIIFYNTGLSALLAHSERMLEKIKDVFKVFKENKDEVALLWRPHPLIRATISSMRPALWEEYEKIVEQYKAEGWGIYDDSADMDRAVALCDAYYGDWSSVMHLCRKADIPVMLQDALLTGLSEF